MRRSELDYDLPAERIAQHPAEPRDASRLLVLNRASGRIEHRVFRDLGEYLRAGDVLVLNDTRVLPARFFCRRRSGGSVECLFLREERTSGPPGSVRHQAPDEAPGRGALWRVLLRPSARLDAGEVLTSESGQAAVELLEKGERGQWLVRPEPPIPAEQLLARIGRTPLPPYIRRDASAGDADPHRSTDAERYQTVYARAPGSVAAPTAGLHFTPELLNRIERLGVRIAHVTLHVGLGTFAPIEVEDLVRHRMHAEWFEVTPEAAEAIERARSRGGRIVAVGTTAARVLESLPADPVPTTPASPTSGWTDLFIYPPHEFRRVDALLTNFHLPGSTLLAMVMAFAGVETVRAAYREAIARGYRFYSFGDAMLILPAAGCVGRSCAPPQPLPDPGR